MTDQATPTKTLADALTQLAQAREVQRDITNKQTAMVQAVTQSQDYLLLQALANHAKDAVTSLEAAVRRETLICYAMTADKHPHPAVSIRIERRPVYEMDEARKYCFEHMPGAMKLDEAAFKKVALAGGLPFVTIEEKPTATIATDLSEWAKAKEEVGG